MTTKNGNKTTKNGDNQNFFRTRMYVHSSFKKPIFVSAR